MWLHTRVFSCLKSLVVCIGLALNICLHDPVHDGTLYKESIENLPPRSLHYLRDVTNFHFCTNVDGSAPVASELIGTRPATFRYLGRT